MKDIFPPKWLCFEPEPSLRPWLSSRNRLADRKIPRRADREEVAHAVRPLLEGQRDAADFRAADLLGDDAEAVAAGQGAERLALDRDARDLREDPHGIA